LATRAQIDERKAAAPMPSAVRWSLAGVLGVLLAGALYLIVVRGDALMLDLSKLGRVFCF